VNPAPPLPATDKTPASLSVSKAGELVGQMRLINGIFAALNSSLEIDDLHLILLTVLTAPRGLGFTRAHLFAIDPEGKQFLGRMALGCGSESQVSALEREIRSEETLLAAMASGRARGAERGAMRRELIDLRNQSWWITAFQRAQVDNPLSRAVAGRPLLGPSGQHLLRRQSENGDIRALHVQGRRPPRFLDARTAALLGDEFLMAPLRTKRGIRAVVAVDRAFRPQGITGDDVANFEWLCNQASLALENAELYADLRHAYSEIQAVDTMKSNFLSTISHELKTPLTSILGFVQLIRDGKAGAVNPTMHRLLDKVVAKSRDLGHMVNDILEIAELQAESLVRIDREAVGVEEVVERAIHRVAQRRRSASVEIEHHRPAEPLPRVLGDEQALERIFFHIIDNAVKFIPVAGKVTIRYRAAPRNVEVAVRDTGIGIAPQHLHRIFDHFYQIDSDLGRAYNGVGLGLAVTKKLLTILGGQIRVQSTPGRGSTFRLSFPIAPPPKGSGK
jgi:signal transduction histidine kinase